MNFRWIYGLQGRNICNTVRKKVFVEEQQFSEDLEFDDVDFVAWHLSVEENGQPIAAARLFQEKDGTFHCGRICALPEWRGKGLGLQVMAALEEKAKELGAKELTLGAQCRASGFYEKAGYTVYGDLYYDEYCPHVPMKKLL